MIKSSSQQTEVLVHADSIFCLVQMQDSKDIIGDWEGQVKKFQMSLSNTEVTGIDGIKKN